MVTIDGENYYTNNEAASRLGLTPAVLRNYRSEGRDGVPHRKMLGRALYRVADVERAVHARGVAEAVR